MPPLKDQLRQLIDSLYGGSVNAAARDIGLPQATLARMVDGRVTNPKTDSLRPIAAHFGASIDWLLTGEGQGPKKAQEGEPPLTGALLRWYHLVDSLIAEGYVASQSSAGKWGLSEEQERALLHIVLYDLATRDFRLGLLLGPGGDDGVGWHPDAGPRQCIELFQHKIDALGSAMVVSNIREHLPLFAFFGRYDFWRAAGVRGKVLRECAEIAIKALPHYPHRREDGEEDRRAIDLEPPPDVLGQLLRERAEDMAEASEGPPDEPPPSAKKGHRPRKRSR